MRVPAGELAVAGDPRLLLRAQLPQVILDGVAIGAHFVDHLTERQPFGVPLERLYQLVLQRLCRFAVTCFTRALAFGHFAAVTEAIHQVGPDVPVVDVLSMDDVIAKSLSSQRFVLYLLASFAGLALLLAAVGIYGVLSYTVRRRVREIGIRMALGASSSDVLKMVVTDGMKPILIGVGIGLAAALALSRLIVSLIFHVRPTDPATFAAVAALLIAVGIAANILPAYRATRIEPTRTLRRYCVA